MTERPLLSLTRLGWGVVVPVLFLSALGLACIHLTDHSRQSQTANAHSSVTDHGIQGALGRLYARLGETTTKQIMFLAAGIGLMFLVVRPAYQSIGHWAYPLYGVAVALLALLVLGRLLAHLGLPELPFVPAVRGTYRWIGHGTLKFQPSEFAKLALVLTLARYLRFRHSYRRWQGLIPPFLLTLVPMVLILFQPDLGTLLLLLPVLFAMLFIAGARLRHLTIVVLLGCATLPLFYKYGMKDYQRVRFQVLLKQNSPDEAWHADQGFQLRQAKTALGTGGLTGTRYGAGMFVQYDLLPEEHNDFIFAIIGHQWGLIGGLLVILAYALVVLFGLEIATATNDPFGRLLAIGVIVMIVSQALLNIAMNVGLAPITGMPLPFVSAGGSSLWTNFLGLGLLLNVARRRPLLIARPPFEYEEE